MKVKFKQPRCIDGVDYYVGVCDVPDKIASHWYFLAAVANGVAVVVEAPSQVVEVKQAEVIVEAPVVKKPGRPKKNQE